MLVIRLQNGSECTEPGYFRDVTDCQRFYYCSTIEDGQIAGLSQSDLVELAKITRNGIKCPDGAIFDEVVGVCQNIALVGSVPPECKQPGIRQQVYSGLKTGMVADITNNAH